ncbi:hypothetical protein N0V90_000915 [Kalmusia sp. IMI 367209]|nr:hypothetical protein N0V90_000915 [Kalmusia sp. IMI 367209]
MTIVIMAIDSHFGPIANAKYDIEAPSEKDTVTAMAINAEGNPVITWRCAGDAYKIITYSSFPDDLNTMKYHDETVQEILDRDAGIPSYIEDPFGF